MLSIGAQVVAGMRSLHAARKSGSNVKSAQTDPIAFLSYVGQDANGLALQCDNLSRIFTDAWQATRKAKTHLAFTSPPGLGKSTLARLLTMWEIGRNPALMCTAISGDLPVAKSSVSLARQIALSPNYREVFPEVEPDNESADDKRGWAGSEWYLKRKGQRQDPTFQAKAADMSAESIRVNILLADDVVTRKIYETAKHETICNAFFSTWIDGRLKGVDGWCCYLQNVRGKNDLLHQLRINNAFCSVWVGVTADRERMFIKIWNAPDEFPVILRPADYGITECHNPDVDEIAPQFYGEFELPHRPGYSKNELAKVSAKSFATMYQHRCEQPGRAILPNFALMPKPHKYVSELLGISEDENGLPVIHERDMHRFTIAAGVDFSGKTRAGTCVVITARDSRGNRYVLEMHRMKADIAELVRVCNGAWARGIRWTEMRCEDNGVQGALIQAIGVIAGLMDCPWKHTLTSHTTNANKFDPQLGLPGLDVKFQTGAYLWAGAEKSRHAEWRDYEIAVPLVTRETTRKETPDLLMAHWFSDSALDRCTTYNHNQADEVFLGVPVDTGDHW